MSRLKVLKGKYAKFSIPLPKEVHSHQNTTPEKIKKALFQILKAKIGDFSSYQFVDLFSGSGQIGLEALSCGFSFVYFCEINFKRRNDIRKILQKCNTPKQNYQVLPDGWRFLKNLAKYTKDHPVPLVLFADPPYPQDLENMTIYEKLIEKATVHKNIVLVIQAPRKLQEKFPQAQSYPYGSNTLLFFAFPYDA